ncbi:LOW QUALITY PROTEIN: hypothetical protein PHMEG_00033410 [Phytophthora megakarya]|uniref:Uncharacterized protein n=1 Tax=Phytophthora megakarya TaxID=4795 RepID=A0A225UTM6_9STRA|nr:LOW QUALITY PROTEIN: hypothetical protein PHMEG_00033410 [Phytophthora megakarya]
MATNDHAIASDTAGEAVIHTLSRRHLNGDQVRSTCTATNTKEACKKYIKGISTWVHDTQPSPDTFFCADHKSFCFLPKHFEAFLRFKLNEGNVQVPILNGYRSELNNVYRQKRMDLPTEYLDDLKTFFRGLKSVEADDNQTGRSRKAGEKPLTFFLYVQLAERTVSLGDNGFSHLFILTQWNLMCRPVSMETLHITHMQCADASVGCVLRKTKPNQQGSGPKHLL